MSDKMVIYLAQCKSPTAAVVLELLGNIFGFSGVGVAQAGNLTLGLVLMFSYWLFLAAGFSTGLILLTPLWIFVTPIVARAVANSHNRKLAQKLGIEL